MNRIAAAVICFHPDEGKLKNLLLAVAGSVERVILFDNGGLNRQSLPTLEGKLFIESRGGQNLGVASALNLACEAAWSGGCRYVVTFDQDSLPEEGMIPSLYTELRAWQGRGEKVAAIGPQLVDVRYAEIHVMPFLVPAGRGSRKETGDGTYPVSQLITSGCLLDLQVWRDEARFDDRLFIDYVDHNWCWRLALRNYLLLGTSTARMRHELSAGLVELSWITLTKYSPERRYFQCRNAVYQLLYQSFPASAKRFLLKNLASTIIAAAWADDATGRSLWQCVRGCSHGLLQRLGPFR